MSSLEIKLVREQVENLSSTDKYKKLNAIKFWKNRDVIDSNQYVEKMFSVNDIYDSSVINILASFGEIGVKILFDKFFIAFQNGLNIDFESEYGAHIKNSLVKYVYKNKNIQIILDRTFDLKLNNEKYKMFFYNILEISLVKQKFNLNNSIKLQECLEKNKFIFTRLTSITENNKKEFFKDVYEHIKLRNDKNCLQLQKSKNMGLYIKSGDILPGFGEIFLDYIDLDIDKELRDYLYVKYKEIIELYYKNDLSWAQNTVGVIIYIEIFLDIPIRHSYLSKISYLVESYGCYVDSNLLEKYINEKIFNDTKDYALKNRNNCLDGYIWNLKTYECLMCLLQIHDLSGIRIIKKVLRYIYDNEILINDVYVNNIVVSIKCFFDLIYLRYNDFKEIDKNRFKIGKEWEYWCFKYLSQKYKNIDYQIRLPNNDIADIGINFDDNFNKYDIIVECKKSLYFLEEQKFWQQIKLENNPTVEKYLPFCNKLIFFVLDSSDKNIELEKNGKIQIIFAKDIKLEDNIHINIIKELEALKQSSAELDKKFDETKDILEENPIESLKHYDMPQSTRLEIYEIIKFFDKIKII